MHLQMITIYGVCDDFLKARGHKDHDQTQMTSAEVMTAQLTACWFFGGNLRRALAYLAEGKLMKFLLSESRFNRRLHRFAPEDWQAVLTRLAELAPDETFLIDSCPVPVCRFTRRFRSRLYPPLNAVKGYSAPPPRPKPRNCSCDRAEPPKKQTRLNFCAPPKNHRNAKPKFLTLFHSKSEPRPQGLL